MAGRLNVTTLDDAVKLGPETLLTEAEVAQVLRKSHRTIERWRLDDRGPKATMLGRNVLYKVRSVLNFVNGTQYLD